MLIVTDSVGTDFWVNLILTMLAWIPGWIHAMFVVARIGDPASPAPYFRHQPTAYTEPAGYAPLPASMPGPSAPLPQQQAGESSKVAQGLPV